MGMYDSVMVKCPKCVEEHEFQTKSGECLLDVYTLDNCPDDVMVDVNRHSPYKCDCGEVFQVAIPTRKAVSVYCDCDKPTLGINTCGCGKWFKIIPNYGS